MKNNKNINGFTIMELMIAITIIWIIFIWSTNINFKYISDRQKLEIFTNKIISEIERIRNNSLIWKWIWTTLIVPEKWKIEFNSWWNWTSTWNIITSYYNWSIWIQENNLKIEKLTNINKVDCIDVSWLVLPLNNTQTWTIIFEWWKYNLLWDCPSNYSNIEIYTSSLSYTWSINFDVVSWLIKK